MSIDSPRHLTATLCILCFVCVTIVDAYLLYVVCLIVCVVGVRRVNVSHERTRMASFGAARVYMTLDVRGESHAQEILASLRTTYKDNAVTVDN